MKKLIPYVLLITMSFNVVSQEAPLEGPFVSPFQNMREAKSALVPTNQEDEIIRIYDRSKSLDQLKKIMEDSRVNTCASKVVAAIESQLNLRGDQEVEQAIFALRVFDSIDDIAAGILIKASKLSRPPVIKLAKDDLTPSEENKAMELFKNKAKDFKNRSLCMEDTYRDLVTKLAGGSPKFLENLKYINKLAVNYGFINDDEFRTIEVMRKGKVYEWPLTLSDYAQNLSTIKKQFPARVKQSSMLVTDTTEGKFRNKKSHRQSLHEKYSPTQIILLGNMVRDLKTRLESSSITININYVDRPVEVVDLTPMERFRFILKLLRKELITINNSSLLNGNRASYIDIITAGYEVGYISDLEIEQLASLEDVWNPKRTTKERVMAWGKRFGGMASIFLPPPYGFVSVLTIMIIDQYVAQAPIDQDPDYNIF